MNDQPRVEWVGRVDVAEVAEALGVASDMVMAVHSDGVVLWTDAVGDDDDIWAATLGRDADGIIVVGPRRSTGTLAEFKARMDAAMHDRFDGS